MKAKAATGLLIFATAIGISACANRAHVPFTTPDRVPFYQYNEILWQLIPLQARDAIRADDLACKQYIIETERRAARHNEARK